jgi:cytochrome c553
MAAPKTEQASLRAAATIALFALALTGSQAWSATPPDMARNCETCHGAGGDSQVTSTPRLNGQQAGYIVDRLKKLSEETRKNPHAKIGMFKDLPAPGASSSIAQYFASQPATAPKPGPRALEGKNIYEKGSAADNVIACDQCHGAQGEGHDSTPRIAGQHADYLRAQLRLFSLKFRDHPAMKPNTKTMTGSTAEALVDYLAND